MARASASGAVDLGLIQSRFKLMTPKLVFTASQLEARRTALKGQCGEQAGKFTCYGVRKDTWRDFLSGVVDGWLATPKRTGNSAVIVFS